MTEPQGLFEPQLEKQPFIEATNQTADDLNNQGTNSISMWAQNQGNSIMEAQKQAELAKQLKEQQERAEAAQRAARTAQRQLSDSINGSADLNSLEGVDQSPWKLGNKALAIGTRYIGTPYVWGGNSLTEGVDCSGLVQQIWNKMGVKGMPRVAADQANFGRQVRQSNMKPGDRLYFSKNGYINHTGIYAGNGMMLEAPYTGAKVRLVPLNRPVAKVMRG